MRLDDLYSYNSAQTLSEAPYGMMDKMKDKIQSKTPFADKDGAKGNMEAGNQANALYKEFKKYVGKVVGRGQKQIDAQVLIDFLGSKGMQANVSGVLQPKDAQAAIMQAVRSSHAAPQANAEPTQPRRANPETKTKPQNNEPQASPKPGDTTNTYPESSKPAPKAPETSGSTNSEVAQLGTQGRKLALAQLKKL